ncbi:sensor histidine kinase [Bosea vestrisii]|uniref:sensor histidine kinase n=1 Tax=Bosea vestrisii TaxID=151416 RepID=UPI0024DF7497|nr:sensor histidine kinase [Bosea vestrisii]WID96680.1 sensor histidine kinase [Bosea vestrisii]
MMHLQLRHELDLETYLEPSVIALSDGSVHAFNRAASQLLNPASSISSLLDMCSSGVETLQTYLLACSGSRQPLIQPVSFHGPDGTIDYRCFGNVLVPRRRSRPATLLLRLFPALDTRFSAAAERIRRLTAERQQRVAVQQFDELRSDRLRLVEQYCFVAEALRVVEARTHELQDEINHIRCDERERIARDLHDHAGQEMALVLAALQALQDGAKGPAKKRLEEIAEHIAGVGRKIHHAVVNGRPRIIEELGFERAIESMVASVATDGRLAFSFKKKGSGPAALPVDIENTLYRVAQEALTNVLKHAFGARKVDVILEFTDSLASLAIADDGIGLSGEAMHLKGSDAGIGLRGMRQRLADINGTLTIGPRLGKGTIVTATAPLASDLHGIVPS